MHLPEALPFVFGLLVILAQPKIDTIWLGRYVDAYADDQIEHTGGARWAADLAQFIPGAILVLVGLTLLLDQRNVSAVAVMLVDFVAFLGVVASFAHQLSSPSLQERRSWPAAETWSWTLLQGVLFAANLAGLVAWWLIPVPSTVTHGA